MQPSLANDPIGGPATGASALRHDQLRRKAQELEAAFLAEMLAYAGLDSAEGEFSGGVGEQQFASFLREAQAKAIVDRGGIGLAETLYRSMVKGEGENG